MTDTYRIKPLVWINSEASVWWVNQYYGGIVAVCGRVPGNEREEDFWQWKVMTVTGDKEKELRCGSEIGRKAAREAAEAAYRDLLMVALEPVETPAVPQNQS